MSSAANSGGGDRDRVVAEGVDDEPTAGNRRLFQGWRFYLASGFAALYAVWHVYTLNVAPMETWAFRITHVMGALILGFLLFSATHFLRERLPASKLHWLAAAICALPVSYALVQVGLMQLELQGGAQGIAAEIEIGHFGLPLLAGTGLALLGSWLLHSSQDRFAPFDLVLILAALASSGYLLVHLDGTALRMRAGTPFATPGNLYASLVGVLLILELTRRVAGLALVIIALIFVGYAFVGPWLPGFLAHQGFDVQRFFSYIYTDAGILGPTTAVSSTYIILFIIFAAFLQASKVGDYFVNFAFALAGRARGGPAKVAIFASGLMGMINGTSAGNVVATGSLTIPLMKRIGYPPKSAGAVEAAASTGGQIMPPIMGAGAFIMAEITGIPYTEIAVAAIIPAILYFASVYFMVDFEAGKLGMRGMRDDELPRLKAMLKQVFLFLPIIILIAALFMGYSVIRAGTLAMAAAAVVSWLTPHRMGPKAFYRAFEMGGSMSVQIIAVCACAGVIVGVISLTGVGARFSSLLLALAEDSQLLALAFAMFISILLGMGMPTTAAYAVAASVVAPGLIQLGIQPLTAHFFVFYFAVISAITPPVALASYAAAGISGGNPMETSVTSFKIGLAAFIVPFMFFYNPALLFDGSTLEVLRALITATAGVVLLSGGVQGYFFTQTVHPLLRVGLIVAALCMIEGGWITDLIGIAVAVAVIATQRFVARAPA
ncbi:MAG: TRAP transporter permease [Kiloniellales bacterium]